MLEINPLTLPTPPVKAAFAVAWKKSNLGPWKLVTGAAAKLPDCEGVPFNTSVANTGCAPPDTIVI